MLARRDQAGEMGHVDQEGRADLVRDGAEAGEIDVAGVSRAAGDEQGRLVLAGERFDLVEVDAVILGRTPY
jgi:hypothetical protein